MPNANVAEVKLVRLTLTQNLFENINITLNCGFGASHIDIVDVLRSRELLSTLELRVV